MQTQDIILTIIVAIVVVGGSVMVELRERRRLNS